MSDPAKDAEAIFLAALEKGTAQERASYVEGACAGNAELLARVWELLQCHEQSRGPLDMPPPVLGATVDQPPPTEKAGTRIGPYKLLQQIGAGGMGVVWMAEQTEPIQRKVAIKVIKPGMDSAQVIARFEAERQALALMDHPNIAKVLDAGETPPAYAGCSPRPYFVMELVKAVPLTKYADECHLTPTQRLALFIPVCQAVQHAHQKGIIHRDLKPSNVLVALFDGKPVPKVIDFGVAKATGQKLTERTLFTEFGAVVGTLEYMSPEQAELNQLDIDTRSDIYALGVLLYELLTGTTPLSRKRLKEAALLEVLRLIREEEPDRPSTRLSTTDELPSIAANRGLEPRKLQGLVRGELDWIAMKALEKDRNRRYETASSLARDIERYLADEPVQACPPSASYKLRKFIRKHRAGLLTAAAFVLLLLLAGAGWLWSAFQEVDRLQREGKRSQERTARLQTIEAELNRARDQRRHARWPEARLAVERAEARLTTDDPRALRRRVAEARADLELVSRLEEIRLDQAALQGRPRTTPPIRGNNYPPGNNAWKANVQFDLGKCDPAYRNAFRAYGLDMETSDVDEAVRRIRACAIKDQVVAALVSWAHAKRKAQLPGWQRLLEVARRVEPDPWHRQLHTAILHNDRKALIEMGKDKQHPDRSPVSWMLLADALFLTGEQPLAVQVLRRAQSMYPDDFWLNLLLGSCLMHLQSGATQEAIGFFRAAVALRPTIEVAHMDLAYALIEKGDPDAAIVVCRRGIEHNPKVTGLHVNLGTALFNKGKFQEALHEFRAALRRQPNLAEVHFNVGNALHQLGRSAEAITAYRRAIQLNPGLAEGHACIAVVLTELGKQVEAEAAARKAIALSPQLADAHHALAVILGGQGKLAEAEAAFRQAIRLKPNIEAAAHYNLGVVLFQQNKVPEAAAALRDAIRVVPAHAEAHYYLGHALATLGKAQEALLEFREAVRLKPQFAGPLEQPMRMLVRQLEMQKRLPDFLAGKFQPDSAWEWTILAWTCQQKKLYPAAVRAIRGAFAADPRLAEDMNSGIRYDAGCFAALAASSKGEGAHKPTERDRAAWRQQALTWLRADLAAYTRLADKGKPADVKLVQDRVRHWQHDPDLIGLRDPAALARLPAADRDPCKKLWADVDALLGKARKAKP